MKKAGLFGGTFNPVHFGHLRTALEVMEGFGLDRIDFIPAANPPHKDKAGLAAEKDRLAMLSMAIEGASGFYISEIELKRQGSSYTIDTVLQVTQDQSSAQIQYFLIVGLDTFLEIDTWKSYKEIFETISFIVMSRPDKTDAFPRRTFSGLGGYIKSMVSSAYLFDKKQCAFFHESLKPVYLFPVTPLSISATSIREIARQRRSVRYLVPDAVATYIHNKRLYA